ncbi:DHH family phosphoesterase [Ligilactobacillus ceti]|uniref:Cyclic-di-AMP phosphodiesterase n=1 Tax=Ligilactobacillus ceti DSM 22408 TaxID=1122146 RepID=A0A0R2KIZ6_9LACO|nr:DHH family phosphoesterase [Ligilactobacillus ceti]KRN89337.1 phosphoesterase, DHH family protein [Ligilactobacillus ceti DSM 22408]
MKKQTVEEKRQMPDFLHNERLRLLAIFLGLLALVGVVLAFTIDWILGLILIFVTAIILGFSFRTLAKITDDTNEYISDLSYRIKRGEQDALIRMPIGIIFLNDQKEIQWVNPYLQKYFGKEDLIGRELTAVDKQLGMLVNECWENKKITEVTWNDAHFELLIQSDINAVYLLDVTTSVNIEEKYQNTRLVLGQIFLDNYDEVTKTMDDETISNLNNYITNVLSDWAREYRCYLKRLDDDHFLLLGYRQALTRMENDKFTILDKIREATTKQNYPITLSMGIAYGVDDLTELSKLMQSNLDLALGRGGDQVVVCEIGGKSRYYGGKTNPMAKRTRVRARMISQALQEIITKADQVIVIGHARPDMDAIGACLGVRRICKMNDKQCWIVMDENHLHSDIQRLMDEVKRHPEMKRDFISAEDALEKATKNSLLIMVDHSKPSISINPEIYETMKNNVVIIDHHRRAEEFPENPVLVYIEPYASSACELITELFEYQTTSKEPVTKLDATAMLAGITVDTQSFSLRTGTRTFDAASYLLSVGADPEMLRHFMKENVESYMQRNHLIDLVEFYGKKQISAICAGEENTDYDPVSAAQAADSLLTVSGVVASYVITQRRNGQIGISARSNGEFNVQLVMEKLGGGGHLSNAATQLSDMTILEAKEKLLAILKEEHQNDSNTD